MRIERIGDAALYLGDCRDVLSNLSGERFHSCVCDPPYHLGFMGKAWDGGDVAFRPETWRAVYDALLPGAFLVAFGGTRTSHRMACAIEDAGFEIRDTLMWVYGSGFPKSHDVSKAIDKAAGAERRVVGKSDRHVSGKPEQRTAGLGGSSTFAETIGMGQFVTAHATPESTQWSGWGTALKPAWEPIILARKPLEGTVAANVLKHGAGGINVDACRVGHEGKDGHWGSGKSSGSCWSPGRTNGACEPEGARHDLGRWPANVLHDGSEEVMAAFPNAPGQQRIVGPEHGARDSVHCFGDYGPRETFYPRGDTGSAARFFYCAKATASDRASSRHPTVKPIALMRWLVRLVTPPGGTTLDPFAGTGSTGLAALQQGFRAVLIERDGTYVRDARRKLKRSIEALAEAA